MSGVAYRLGTERLKLTNNVHAIDNLAEDSVSAVQPLVTLLAWKH